MASKTDLCAFCEHPRSSHHAGCPLCHAENRHGHYCEGALCCCTDFMEPDVLSDEDIAAMIGETA